MSAAVSLGELVSRADAAMRAAIGAGIDPVPVTLAVDILDGGRATAGGDREPPADLSATAEVTRRTRTLAFASVTVLAGTTPAVSVAGVYRLPAAG